MIYREKYKKFFTYRMKNRLKKTYALFHERRPNATSITGFLDNAIAKKSARVRKVSPRKLLVFFHRTGRPRKGRKLILLDSINRINFKVHV